MKRETTARYLRLLPYVKVGDEIIGALSGKTLSIEKVPIDSTLRRVCAETLVSPCDVPAVSISSMDGYAVRSVDIEKADSSNPVLFNVRGSLQAGSEKPRAHVKRLDAYYVGTGAPIPSGADVVVKIEETRLVGGRISVSRKIPKWKNITPKGDDVRKGRVVVSKGDIINAAGIALLIAIGRSELSVFRAPRIGILSTGDELTPLGEKETGKKVNNYSNLMAGYLVDASAVPVPLGVAGDSGDEILDAVERNVARLDGVITLGGSSVGERDFTATSLHRAHKSVEVFHGIKLVPVRPTGLYMVDDKPVVLLPGHCVAAALSFFLVVKPILNLLSGLDFHSRAATVRANLSDGVSNPRPIGALFLAKLTGAEGKYVATPLPWGSNRISSLMEANAFLSLEPDQKLKVGEVVTAELLGSQEFSRIPRRSPQ